MAILNVSKKLFDEAKRYIPSGVNSPVRSFRAVGRWPVFIKKGKGSKVYSECGEEFIDYCLSWGPLILGHAHPEVTKVLGDSIKRGTSFGAATRLETELARLIVEAVPSVEQVRLTSSGTEAVMGAVRLARAYTKRKKIVKFEGSYHGHADYLLAKAGSGIATLAIPDSLGVPKEFTSHTLTVPFNDIDKLKKTIDRHKKDIAAVIIEPVPANCGVILPKEGFLKSVREITRKNNIVLIFDEVITGFRLSYSGAQGYFGIKPDLTCFGKIIGGGLPVGGFAGKRRLMRLLAPEGDVYQAGTLSGNPIAVTAGITTLRLLKKNNPYEILCKNTKNLCRYLIERAKYHKIDMKVNYIGSLFSVFFIDKEVADYKTARKQNLRLFKRFYNGLLKEGVYLSPSGFEANFLSTVHTQLDLTKTKKAIDTVLKNLRRS